MTRATGKWCLDCEAINLWCAVRCCRCGHSFDANESPPGKRPDANPFAPGPRGATDQVNSPSSAQMVFDCLVNCE